MLITQKCQYALRAVYELAKYKEAGPLKIGIIAERQNIPSRFLENILGDLKKTQLVDSVRGKDGGYILRKPANEITVGTIIRYIEGPLRPVQCTGDKDECCFANDCVFKTVWDKAKLALESVYDTTTIQDLLDSEHRPLHIATNCISTTQEDRT